MHSICWREPSLSICTRQASRRVAAERRAAACGRGETSCRVCAGVLCSAAGRGATSAATRAASPSCNSSLSMLDLGAGIVCGARPLQQRSGMQSCVSTRSDGVCDDKFGARMRHLLWVARSPKPRDRASAQRSMRDGSRAGRRRRRRVRCAAASKGGRRTARVPVAGPSRDRGCSAKGRRAAGAVAWNSVVCRRARNPCGSAWRKLALRGSWSRPFFWQAANHATQLSV